MQAIDLSPLKDVILPPAPSIFPLPWGYWAVIAGVIVALCAVWALIYFIKNNKTRYALKLLDAIQASNTPLPAQGVAISALLKRICLSKYPREQVAPLSSKKWSQFLQSTAHNALSAPQADFIASSVYMPKNKTLEIDLKSLYTNVKIWIKLVLKEKTHGNHPARHFKSSKHRKQ